MMRSLYAPLFWMKRVALAIAVVALLSGMTGLARADLVYFTDRAAFDAANPGTTLDDFENATPGVLVSGPQDRFSDNDGFKPGDIIPNLRITAVGPSPAEFLVSGGAYTPTFGLTTNYGGNVARLDFFEEAINAFGIDVYGSGQEYTISIFGTSGLLDTRVVTADAFFGFSSTDGITRVELDNVGFEAFDNIAIGVRSVPEPSSLAMFAGGAIGLLCYGWRRRARTCA